MKKLNINIGELVHYQGKQFVVARLLDVDLVMGEEVETGLPVRIPVNELSFATSPINSQGKITQKERDLALLPDADWQQAQRRYAIIRPLLADRGNWDLVQQIAKQHKVHYSTLYRWIARFDETGSITVLAGRERTGGRGRSRLKKVIDQIINKAIEETYLTTQRKPITRTILEIKRVCHVEGITPPHPHTIRNRISSLSQELVVQKRYSRKQAKESFEPQKGHFPGADFPLSIVHVYFGDANPVISEQTGSASIWGSRPISSQHPQTQQLEICSAIHGSLYSF